MPVTISLLKCFHFLYQRAINYVTLLNSYKRIRGVFQFHLDSSILILATSNMGAQISKPGENFLGKTFFVKVNTETCAPNILAYQRNLQLLKETLRRINRSFGSFTVRHLSFVDRKTDKSKDSAPKQYYLQGRKNNWTGYHHPNYFSGIDPGITHSLYLRLFEA